MPLIPDLGSGIPVFPNNLVGVPASALPSSIVCFTSRKMQGRFFLTRISNFISEFGLALVLAPAKKHFFPPKILNFKTSFSYYILSIPWNKTPVILSARLLEKWMIAEITLFWLILAQLDFRGGQRGCVWHYVCLTFFVLYCTFSVGNIDQTTILTSRWYYYIGSTISITALRLKLYTFPRWSRFI